MKRFALAFALTALAAGFLAAQYQGKVEVRVVDESGKPLEKAEVSIVSQKSAAIRYDHATDKEGRFIQVGLTPGNYMINVKKAGFAPVSKEIRVSIAGEDKYEVTLRAAEAAEMKSLSAADRLFLKGNGLYAAQKYAEAAAAYEEAVANSQSNWAYFLNLGLAYKKLDRPADAERAFRKAVELNAESFSANKELGEVLAKLGRPDEAGPFYEKAAALNPEDPDIHYNLGLLLNAGGNPEKAFDEFTKAVELRPDFAEAYYEMGTILIGRNKVAEAVASLEKFLKLAPDHEKAAIARQLLEYLKK
jgi:tetratricopeptide (TPR) repeat protein